jgi:hypothetical protein
MAATLPLAMSVTLLTFAWRIGWLGTGNLAIAKGAAVVAGLFYVVEHLALASAVAPAKLLPVDNGLLGLLALAGNYLLGSIASYGVWRFAAAVIVGGLLGHFWHQKVMALVAAWHGEPPQTDAPSAKSRRAA